MLARNLTSTCNRTRSAVRFSDNLFAYPIRNVSTSLEPRLQVLQEGTDLSQTISSELRAGCVDRGFLRDLRRDVSRAITKAVFGGDALVDQAIAELQDATVVALGTTPNPYGSCPNEPKGEIGSRLLDLTFQVHRGIRYPDTFVLYQIPSEISDLLPPFTPGP